MDKAKLFLVAVAPAALIVPMEVQAAETSMVKITGNNIEGALLTADISLIPKDQTITSYQWFYDEGLDTNGAAIHIAIPNATESTLIIPVGAAEKAIIVKVETQNGPVYTSEKSRVNAILPTAGERFVNGKVYAEINKIAGNPVVKSYQWYYFENGKKTPIKGATNIELTILPEAAEKELIVEAISEAGKTYTSASIPIDKLQLEVAPLTIKGYSPERFVLSGDTLTVVNPAVKDNTRELKADQISYAYQWMYKVGDSYSYISGATGATYKIPADEQEMKQIVVRVTVTVGTTTADPQYSQVISVANTPAQGLVDEINALLKKDGNKAIVYTATSVEQFGTTLEELLNKYNALTTVAQANVTNYDIVKRAVEDHKLIKALKDKIDAAKKLDDANPAKRQKFKELEAEYEKLNLLQRSIDINVYTDIQSALGNAQTHSEISEVKAINTAILNLLDGLEASDPVQYKITSIAALQSEIKDIEDRMAKLSSEYKMIVQNQDILKTAKADIKKVQAFLDKANKIDVTATAKKQVAAAKAVRTAYEKLNVKQQSLVPADYDNKLIQAEQAEEEGVEAVQEIINAFITVESEVAYHNIPTAEGIKEINKAIATYKTLSKDNAKKVIGYAELVQLQKDIKTAEKVMAQIEKYQLLLDTEGISYSKVNSAYNSAAKAFNKLTALQKSLVNNAHKLIAPTKPEQAPNDKPLSEEEEQARAQGTALISEIDQALATSKTDFASYAQEIEKMTNKYKSQLKAPARKYVTNYEALKAAEKDVKAVQSFLKKVEAAGMEGDIKKRYAKIQSVQKAYLNLSANQQELAKTNDYIRLLEILTDDTIYTNLNELDQEMAALSEGNASIEKIKALESTYKKLSAAEQKKIINYPILKQAIADAKKVDAFIAQYNKMLENPAKNTQNAIKSFNALSAQQANLVPNDIREEIITLEKKQREFNDQALALIDEINGLVDAGKYVSGLQSKVDGLRTNYEALSTAQQSLVKNYAKLTKAENDLVKVAEVRALEEAINVATEEEKIAASKTWQDAFNKLSKQLEQLYIELYPTRSQ